jgi:transcriptional regulator with XRE-family HTH domain
MTHPTLTQLIALRKQAGVTYLDLQNKGISNATVTAIEKGGNPTLKSVAKYLNAIGYKLDNKLPLNVVRLDNTVKDKCKTCNDKGYYRATVRGLNIERCSCEAGKKWKWREDQ